MHRKNSGGNIEDPRYNDSVFLNKDFAAKSSLTLCGNLIWTHLKHEQRMLLKKNFYEPYIM